jgi:ribosomal protein S8E
VTRKVRILDVKYNASNNELVRTQTLVKNAIVEVDAAPFKQWYLQVRSWLEGCRVCVQRQVCVCQDAPVYVCMCMRVCVFVCVVAQPYHT